jgi:hypothetical protein
MSGLPASEVDFLKLKREYAGALEEIKVYRLKVLHIGKEARIKALTDAANVARNFDDQTSPAYDWYATRFAIANKIEALKNSPEENPKPRG